MKENNLIFTSFSKLNNLSSSEIIQRNNLITSLKNTGFQNEVMR